MRRGSVSVRRESVGVEERERDVVERMGSVRRVRDVERENVRKEKDVDVERKERDVVEKRVIVSVKEERDVMERKEKDVDVERRERDVDVERRKDVRVIAVRNNLKRSAWLV